MIVDRRAFFDSIRKSLFPKGFKQQQVDGINMLLSAWEDRYQTQTPITQFANVLATASWETGNTMQPIHEFGDRDYFMRMYDKTGSRPKVAATLGNTETGDGALFAGRGYPQLTGRANYRRATRRLRQLGIISDAIDFETSPDLVMRPQYAIPIMFIGMEEGWFTSKTLDGTIDERIDGDEHSDFVKARAIINGSDRAELIAQRADAFLNALKVSARTGNPAPAPTTPEVPAAPAPEPKAEPSPLPPAPAPSAPSHAAPMPGPVAKVEPAPEVPTPANPAPQGWFEHLLSVLRHDKSKGQS